MTTEPQAEPQDEPQAFNFTDRPARQNVTAKVTDRADGLGRGLTRCVTSFCVPRKSSTENCGTTCAIPFWWCITSTRSFGVRLLVDVRSIVNVSAVTALARVNV